MRAVMPPTSSLFLKKKRIKIFKKRPPQQQIIKKIKLKTLLSGARCRSAVIEKHYRKQSDIPYPAVSFFVCFFCCCLIAYVGTLSGIHPWVYTCISLSIHLYRWIGRLSTSVFLRHPLLLDGGRLCWCPSFFIILKRLYAFLCNLSPHFFFQLLYHSFFFFLYLFPFLLLWWLLFFSFFWERDACWGWHGDSDITV